jgi:tRNA threonylcarbamoyladenosine biosynthesis protein TsaE
MVVLLPDEVATAALARRLAGLLRPGDRVALNGPMGAGKTTFVRHLVAALGGDATCVTSPTYTLLHRYESDPPVIHVDACRLHSPGQLAALGFDELGAEAIAVVEWAAQVVSALDPTWSLAFAHAEGGRSVTITAPPGMDLVTAGGWRLEAGGPKYTGVITNCAVTAGVTAGDSARLWIGNPPASSLQPPAPSRVDP